MLEFILQVISRSSKEAGYLSQVTQKSATKAEGSLRRTVLRNGCGVINCFCVKDVR